MQEMVLMEQWENLRTALQSGPEPSISSTVAATRGASAGHASSPSSPSAGLALLRNALASDEAGSQLGAPPPAGTAARGRSRTPVTPSFRRMPDIFTGRTSEKPYLRDIVGNQKNKRTKK